MQPMISHPRQNTIGQIAWLSIVLGSPWLVWAEEDPSTTPPALIRVANQDLRVGVDGSGSLRELSLVSDGDNRLGGDGKEPFSLWEIDVATKRGTITLAPTRAESPRIARLSEKGPGLRMVWDKIPLSDGQSLGVVVEVQLDEQGSHWSLRARKPSAARLKAIRFPRVPSLKPREHEVVAVPEIMGRIVKKTPRHASKPPASSSQLALSLVAFDAVFGLLRAERARFLRGVR